ncbi:hypothetical protein D3C87_351190 [compost metagenome]
MSTSGYISISSVDSFAAFVPCDGYPSNILSLLASCLGSNNSSPALLKQKYEQGYLHLPEHYQPKMVLDMHAPCTEPEGDLMHYEWDYIIAQDKTLTCRNNGKPVHPLVYIEMLNEDAMAGEKASIEASLVELSRLGYSLAI